MYLLAKFDVHGSYGNVDINSYINFYMINSERAKRTARSPILRDFQNQEYRFQRLAENQEEEDYGQLQSVMTMQSDSRKIFWSFSIALKHTTLISTETYSLEIVLV